MLWQTMIVTILGWETGRWLDRRFLLTQRLRSLYSAPWSSVRGHDDHVDVVRVHRGRVHRTVVPGPITAPGAAAVLADLIHPEGR